MKCHIFVDYGGGLCLLRNTSFNEQSIKVEKIQVSGFLSIHLYLDWQSKYFVT